MKLLAGLFLALLLTSCSPPPYENEYRRDGRYEQNFKTTEAYLVLEWNNKPMILASGFLADKEKGIFYTAKHFTDNLGSFGVDYCKLFFNGRVYRAELIRVPPIRDAALLRITSPFSSIDFPEPLPLAEERPLAGDKVYVRGFHPHHYMIRKGNEDDGFPDIVLRSMLEDYYGFVMKDLSKELQVVYDGLEGVTSRPDPDSVLNNNMLSDDQKKLLLELENDQYIKVLMTRDHKFSFGGLSGGAAVNESGEVVGVITAQDIFRFEYDDEGSFVVPDSGISVTVINKQVFDTLYITPIDSLGVLEKYIKNIK